MIICLGLFARPKTPPYNTFTELKDVQTKRLTHKAIYFFYMITFPCLDSNDKKSVRGQGKLDICRIVNDLDTTCCASRCLQQTPASFGLEKRQFFLRKSLMERHQCIENAAAQSEAFGKRNAGRGPAKRPFVVEGGAPCCTKARCTIYGVSLSRFVF